MRRLLIIGTLVLAIAGIAVLGTGAGEDSGGDYRVRVIFDNAFSLIEGEDVRVAGVNVGKIEALEVTADNKAAVVMRIDREGFKDFRSDARCTIRPQSLIGERYVECSLTERRAQGQALPPPLREIPEGRPGEGQRLLPVGQTAKPVDLDLVNNVARLPQRQRLAIILNELGAGVGGRADDLNETVRRANPALGAVNRVLAILGEQNEVLRDLATDSDRVLAPLARDRARVASFIEQSGTVARATADRRADLERSFELLPRFLAELRPTMQRLGSFSDEFQPVLNDLGAAAPSINKMIRELGPFSQAGIPALKSLGAAAEIGRPALLESKPIIDDLRRLTEEAAPLADDLSELLTSFRDTGGIERLMDYIFFQASAVNGFDSLGHYLRAGLIVNTCSQYAADPGPGCSSKYQQPENPQARASAQQRDNVVKAFQASAGADHSAQALRAPKSRTSARGGHSAPARTLARRGALKLPRMMLPGHVASAPQPRRPSGARPSQAARDGLLDYLLGAGS